MILTKDQKQLIILFISFLSNVHDSVRIFSFSRTEQSKTEWSGTNMKRT